MPYSVANQLTDGGHELLSAAELVESWLELAPNGPIAIGSEPAKRTLRALIGGWQSGVLHVLTAGPLSLTELSSVLPEIPYPTLERRLSALRATGQLIASVEGGGAKPCSFSDWGRRAAGPLAAASRWERRHLDDAGAICTTADLEACLHLTLPLVTVPDVHGGSCLLTIDTDAEPPDLAHRPARLSIEVENGHASFVGSGVERDSHSRAGGGIEAWTEAMIDGGSGGLCAGGEDPALARAIIAGLHEAVAPARTRRSP
jgi:DNA-binding HxlR family transcriptional regulator